jgi:hypothetical protein
MSYCTVDDVCTVFPRFVRNAANSIQDTQIRDWIDDRKARIRSALYARGIDPDVMALTPDQANFLRALNRDGAIADLADALQGNVSLQAGEDAHAAQRRQSFEGKSQRSSKVSTTSSLASLPERLKSSRRLAAQPAVRRTAPRPGIVVRIKPSARIKCFENREIR